MTESCNMVELKTGGPAAFGGLKLIWLQVFVAVVESGKGTAAAVELDLGQTTVSRHIKALEKWSRRRLLDQTGGRPLLTVEGAKFMPVAKQILALAEAFRSPSLDVLADGKMIFQISEIAD